MNVANQKGKFVLKKPEIALNVDLIRTVAIVLVILLHASIEAVPDLDIMSSEGVQLWWASNVYNSIARSCVPLFIMLTGALLLQASKTDEPMRVFFKKRWNRIGLPVIFWGAVYLAWDFTIRGQPLTLTSFLQDLLAGPYIHFWYVYVLVGLYLITPLVRVFVSYAEWKLARYFFFIWFIGTGVAPLLTLSESIRAQATWFSDNVFILTGLVGYFILGAYIDKLRMHKSVLYLGLILSTVWTIIGTYALINKLGEFYGQFFFSASSFSVIAASISLFIILATFSKQKIQERYLFGRRALRVISENTLPIYLFHVIVLETLQGGFLGIKISVTNLNPFLEIPLVTLITLLICLAIIIPLKKIPYIKKLLG